MLADLIADFLRELAIAAIDDHAMVEVTNDVSPARFVAMDPDSKLVMAAFVPRGESVRVNRAWRLIIEPIDAVMIRPLCVTSERWSIE